MKILNSDGRWNLHTHTKYCDGKDEPEALVRRAIELGFTKLGFSGHGYAPYDTDVCMSPEGTVQYRNEILKLKKKYRGQIRILLGIEKDFYGEPDDFPYDFVIGSVHYLRKNGVYMCVEDTPERLIRQTEELFGGDYRAVAEQYYDTVAQVVEKTGCDIVGHFDIVTKFNRGNRFFDEDSEWYRRTALRALREAARNRPVFEINTGAMARGYMDRPYPAWFLLDEIDRLDCPVLLSSDCHSAAMLDYGFETLRRTLG